MLILVISVCTALLGEGLTWLLVYRTDKYQVSSYQEIHSTKIFIKDVERLV